MSDLVEFLTARLNEDEQVARLRIEGSDWMDFAQCRGHPHDSYLPHFNPYRVLAEVEAKREVIKLLTKDGELDWHDLSCDWEHDGEEPIYYNETAARVLIALALPYADHPDSAQDWWP